MPVGDSHRIPVAARAQQDGDASAERRQPGDVESFHSVVEVREPLRAGTAGGESERRRHHAGEDADDRRDVGFFTESHEALPRLLHMTDQEHRHRSGEVPRRPGKPARLSDYGLGIVLRGGPEQAQPVGARGRGGIEPDRHRPPLPLTDVGGRGCAEEPSSPLVGGDGFRKAADGHLAAGLRQQHPGILFAQTGGQHVGPRAVPVRQAPSLVADERHRRVPGLGPAVGPERVGQHSRPLEEPSGPSVAAFGLFFPDLFHQRHFEVGPEDLVVSVDRVVADRGGENLLPFQGPEDFGASRAAEQRIAERPGQPTEDAGAEEERPEFPGQLVEHVAGQVLPHHPGPGPEFGDHPAALPGRSAPGGEMEQLESGRPPRGAAGELGEVLGGERFGVEIPEELLDLPGPEA